MKKYLIAVVCCVTALLILNYLHFYNGDLYLPASCETDCISRAEDGVLYIKERDGFKEFDIKGVNLGMGKPGHFATDLAITKEEYLRWFHQIQDMGANVIRIYTIANPAFYEAFYEYNVNNPSPLYLIHGVWVSDYLINSAYSAFDKEFYHPFLESCKDTVDVIHGRFKQKNDRHLFSNYYKWDISPWVYGYILGIEWEGDIVVFTNDCIPQAEQFQGEYLYTENARNFEIFLAGIGNETIRYETEKYGTQHAVAFANWPNTCPLTFSEKTKQANKKYGQIDVEHIFAAPAFTGAMFASYHIYPYYPEYVLYEEKSEHTENTYLAYLTMLNQHHEIPVVISEFGIPASRGKGSYEDNRTLARDQGMMNEVQQGNALVSLCKDIENSGCAGGIVFIWQDEWFKRTWNTIPTVDLENIIYWSDIQTNEQRFGLLSFDPGAEKRMCSIDGDRSDWTDVIRVLEDQNCTLSVQYDIEGIYFLVEKQGFDLERDRIFIPIDLTPKSGSTKAENLKLSMSAPADFIIELNGKENSRVWVQSRYNTIVPLYGPQLKRNFRPYLAPPAADDSRFDPIYLPLHEMDCFYNGSKIPFREFQFIDNNEFYRLIQRYETGKLRYGNADPSASDFDSLADFCAGEGFAEIRIPWQLLNFADPTQMKIHDDYYEHYGVEYLTIDSMQVGAGEGSNTIQMVPFDLKPLGKKPEYHERLKESYYILQGYWAG